jgi:flagellar basal-body rod protein FlgB
MNLDSIPLFSMIKGKLDHVGQREKLIAQNVANADTPGYMPTDLKPFTIGDAGPSSRRLAGINPVRTNVRHLEGEPAKDPGPYGSMDTPDSETTLTGNHVVLEEEMMKMTEARMDYEAAVGFYQKSLEMLRMAARAPGR